jgi:hypothetical protein
MLKRDCLHEYRTTEWAQVSKALMDRENNVATAEAFLPSCEAELSIDPDACVLPEIDAMKTVSEEEEQILGATDIEEQLLGGSDMQEQKMYRSERQNLLLPSSLAEAALYRSHAHLKDGMLGLPDVGGAGRGSHHQRVLAQDLGKHGGDK